MQLKKFDGINVVPMIDIMLVLLVIVLTTATFIAKGVIPLELPHGQSAKEMPREQKIRISISSEGEIYLDTCKMDLPKLEKELRSKDRKSPLFLSCDKRARYERFVEVLDRIKKLGFAKIAIVTTR
ncbi:ExbD/TolR family protein [Nitratifractor sp.]